MKLHLLSVPHVVTRIESSHCAFGGTKVRLFSPMLTAEGYHVIHYGVAGATSGATEDVVLMEQDEHLRLLGISSYDSDPTALVGHLACSDSAAYAQFNFYLRDALRDRLEPGDTICLPFGFAHDAAYKGLPLVESGEVAVVESGIGYPNPRHFLRVFESNAWRHWVLGNEQRDGSDWTSPRHEWIVPNYYSLPEWPVTRDHELSDEDRRTVVYLGRLVNVKGLELIPRLAERRPDLTFVICGQGDPRPYLTHPNIQYKAPISGTARATYLGHARCGIFPSRFVEPFCGASVECGIVGTGVLTSDFGAFTETIIPDVTGYRCRGFDSWLDGLDRVMGLDRDEVAESARMRYGLDTVGPMYARVFEEIGEILAARDSARHLTLVPA